MVLAAALPGCRDGQSPAPTSTAQPGAGRTAKAAPAEEIWEAFYLQGAKIGYGHTTVRRVTRDGRRLVETRSQNHLELTRFGQQTEQDVNMEIVETPEGQVVRFRTEAAFGPSPTVVTGRAENGRLALTTETQGRRATTTVPWSNDIRGFRGIEQSLAGRPLNPGETRRFAMLMPLINQVADVELKADKYEKTPVLGVEAKLLRVESVARLPDGQALSSVLWTDHEGEVIKSRIAGIGQESFRTTRRLALAPAKEGKPFDLGLDLTVRVDPPLARAHETREARYRVALTDGDPAKTFAAGPTQSVRSLGPHSAEITVRSLRPGDLPKSEKPAAAAPPEYTSANSVLQIDDARIRKMAEEARGDASNPRDLAIALEKYVHRVVSEKNFSQAFASAAEVAQTREGDCTEHAVLLAALARACGIASRVAIGLVYVESAGGFGYHMWTEVWLDGQWVPLDAIVGQGGTSAAYLKLADSSLDGATAYSSFLAVASVLGQLTVSVVETK